MKHDGSKIEALWFRAKEANEAYNVLSWLLSGAATLGTLASGVWVPLAVIPATAMLAVAGTLAWVKYRERRAAKQAEPTPPEPPAPARKLFTDGSGLQWEYAEGPDGVDRATVKPVCPICHTELTREDHSYTGAMTNRFSHSSLDCPTLDCPTHRVFKERSKDVCEQACREIEAERRKAAFGLEVKTFEMKRVTARPGPPG